MTIQQIAKEDVKNDDSKQQIARKKMLKMMTVKKMTRKIQESERVSACQSQLAACVRGQGLL